jgi:hypothetical protein
MLILPMLWLPSCSASLQLSELKVMELVERLGAGERAECNPAGPTPQL